jgi:hypothetical protein
MLKVRATVGNNPIKAGLKDWPWVRGQDAPRHSRRDAGATLRK